MESRLFTKARHVALEPVEPIPHVDRSIEWRLFVGRQPIADFGDGLKRVAAMGGCIAPLEVRQKSFEAMHLAVHDQQFRRALVAPSVLPGIGEPELEWHIESWQLVLIQFRNREVVNAEGADVDQVDDLGEPIAGLQVFKSASGDKPAGANCEGYGLKERLVLIIKRAVDENKLIRRTWTGMQLRVPSCGAL